MGLLNILISYSTYQEYVNEQDSNLTSNILEY